MIHCGKAISNAARRIGRFVFACIMLINIYDIWRGGSMIGTASTTYISVESYITNHQYSLLAIVVMR